MSNLLRRLIILRYRPPFVLLHFEEFVKKTFKDGEEVARWHPEYAWCNLHSRNKKNSHPQIPSVEIPVSQFIKLANQKGYRVYMDSANSIVISNIDSYSSDANIEEVYINSRLLVGIKGIPLEQFNLEPETFRDLLFALVVSFGR